MNSKDLAWKVLPQPLLARVAYWRQYLYIGEWEMRILRDIVPPTGLTIDIGANVGYYSYALKRLKRDTLSFEPNPRYGDRLRSLLGDSARIEAVALSDHEGTGTIRVPHFEGGYGGGLGSLSKRAVPDDAISSSYNVRLRTLDSYELVDIAFIKIDVEGHEEAVLEGARETLQRCKPVLLIEIEERHNPGGLDRISSNLAALGYRGTFYLGGKRHSLSDFDPVVHQDENLIDNYKESRRRIPYVNNFVFATAAR